VTVVAKVVIMKQPKLTSMRFLQAGERVRLADHLAHQWVEEGIAEWPAEQGVARATPPEQKPLDKMKKAELVELATSLGVGKADDLKVAELIVAIQAKRKEG
jgi:hypothetical protein